MPASSLTVAVNGVWLHGLQVPGGVGDLQWNRDKHGPLAASWSMSLPRGYQHPALRPNAGVKIYAGSMPVWAGYLPDADFRGGRFVAEGLSRLGEQFLALDGVGNPTTKVDTAVGAAIARGLPWSLPSSISNTSLSSASESATSTNSVATLLDRWCETNGYHWRVDAQGRLGVYQVPSGAVTPTWMATPDVPGMATGGDKYASTLFVRYVSAVSGTPAVPSAWGVGSATSAEAASRFGTLEAEEDISDLGVMIGSTANAIAAAMLRERIRPGFTEGVDVNDYQLFTTGGVPASAFQVTEGQIIRSPGVIGNAGSLTTGGVLDWMVGSVDYRQGQPLRIGAIGLAPSTLAAVLSAQRTTAVFA